ncbi:MAG: N-6 DNA methylase, partial [Methanomassiliicoccaceae archaeon]|nr:N-6 DNA methylase [Methanomassiliicoccaceae archaeon]
KSADTLRELEKIHEDMGKFKVLDPACGSGNFLYIAYIELRHLELELMKEMERFPSFSRHSFHSAIRCDQFYGIDMNPLGIELAKVTLAMAKKKTSDDFNKATRMNRLINPDEPLPFDNLDGNFINGDALFCDWPDVDAIIGNPPYQSKNKMQKEFGPLYLDKLRKAYPEMPGLADYCVYWFRKAHDHLKIGGGAGLVGTNTIRQTNSRVGGLDYIVSNNGEIIEAISTMPWSGTAVVYVSIVNWVKKKTGEETGQVDKILRENTEGKGWKEYKLKTIPSSLSDAFDVGAAVSLEANKNSNTCFQGQTHGHESFLLSPEEYRHMLEKDGANKEVLFPFLIADRLIGTKDSQPKAFVIDFEQRDIFQAGRYKTPFERIEKNVLPTRQMAFDEEQQRNAELLNKSPKAKVNHHHENFLKKWWQLSYPRPDLMNRIGSLNRYISCGRVTKRPIFEFISSGIHPNDALMVFPMDDDYSFGILQSSYHWKWFNARCSTLKGDPRYTSTTVFDSFPWPQWGILNKKVTDFENREKECHSIVLEVAKASKNLRTLRRKTMVDHSLSLRELYITVELPGKNPLKDAQELLDKAVRKAYLYDMPTQYGKKDELEFLFDLNKKCAEIEKTGRIYAPGIPYFFKDTNQIVSGDCVKYRGDYFC